VSKGCRAGVSEESPAARHLASLVPPLLFAVRDGFASLPRLRAFGEVVAGAVDRARRSGAPDGPGLRGLLAEAADFDGRSPKDKERSLSRIAAHLSGLVPLPPELGALAADGRRELGKARVSRPRVPPRELPPESGEPPQRLSQRRGGHRQGPQPVSLDRGVAAALPEPQGEAGRRERRARLALPLAALPRVHPAPRALLVDRGRSTVEEALFFWPRAYQDRTHVQRLAELRRGETSIGLGRVRAARPARMRSGKLLLQVELADEGGRLDLIFFNPPSWRLKQFALGETFLAWGKLSEGARGRLQMRQPEVERVGPGDSANFGRIVPLYSGPADYQQPALRKLMKRLCDEQAPLAVDDLPAEVRERRGLLGIGEALLQAHFPPAGTEPEHAAARATPAFRRLIFEELFFLELALALRRRGVRREPGIAFDASQARMEEAAGLLPFTLTASQRKALCEIAGDMGASRPMNRLLQGDVGSGKTAVAFCAMMLAVRSGYQAALMAPTEILADQHARTLRRWLEGTGIELARVGAKAQGRVQREARHALASGRARIAVGTHALVEESVVLEHLGLAVVDEQHRFGVLERARLIGKGARPDVLVMTATPIPRTLALAFYGDLDHSTIDGLPPGRAPVKTRVFADSQRARAYEIVRRELEAGRQAYVVYPLVAESEKTDLADATGGAEELSRTLAPHAVGLLHGQMGPEEKEGVMDRFRKGELAALVTTTVIEVGVDVPNASVLVVEHAERFGLSQLHQLRGRVGRGAAHSSCLLLAHFRRAGEEARERLRVMESTEDGFEIAKADLLLRGPGELVGTRQSGQRLFDIADLYRDEAILEEAREEAFALAESDPELAQDEHAPAAEALHQRWANRISLAQVG